MITSFAMRDRDPLLETDSPLWESGPAEIVAAEWTTDFKKLRFVNKRVFSAIGRARGSFIESFVRTLC
jgi:hypothetical protein